MIDKNGGGYTYIIKTYHKFILMETLITLTHNFEAVYLVNGVFTEKNVIACDSDDVLYVTVLPLNPLHLSYTVKTAMGRILSNQSLARAFKTRDGFVIKLSPRFSYVYSTAIHDSPADVAQLFFEYVKERDLEKARALLTPELSQSLTDEALTEFFDEYEDIAKYKDGYYLINREGEGEPYEFCIKASLIDDIISR